MLKGQASGQRVPEEFEALVRPHVDSFDYFIGDGMQTVVERVESIEVPFHNMYWGHCKGLPVKH